MCGLMCSVVPIVASFRRAEYVPIVGLFVR